ncbi:hypothetical protein VNO80_20836 [Phaseolus coccineus]|uniref:Uncharacterized protein n=1 Tax=Phaseolus coccineus TaxID=3886 RepID=A0AAN9M1B1_PHACN
MSRALRVSLEAGGALLFENGWAKGAVFEAVCSSCRSLCGGGYSERVLKVVKLMPFHTSSMALLLLMVLLLGVWCEKCEGSEEEKDLWFRLFLLQVQMVMVIDDGDSIWWKMKYGWIWNGEGRRERKVNQNSEQLFPHPYALFIFFCLTKPLFAGEDERHNFTVTFRGTHCR